MPRVLTDLDRQVRVYRDEQIFEDIELNGNGSPKKKPGARRIQWPRSIAYVTCYDPQHYHDMVRFIRQHVDIFAPIPEPGGALVLDPTVLEYPENFRRTYDFPESLQTVREQMIAKIKHGFVRGEAKERVLVLEVHAGNNECGVALAFGWSLDQLLASQLRAADHVRQLVPDIGKIILTFHYCWKVGERNTFVVNEHGARRQVASQL